MRNHIWLLMHFTRVKILNMTQYIFRSIDRMAQIVEKREYEHQMKSRIHHSLIKIIVLYHLKELNIRWSTFIANPIFIDSSTWNVQSIPSPYHPSTLIPPSQLIDHSSSSNKSPLPSPPSSPLHENIHSPIGHEIREQEQIEQVDITKPKGADFGTLTHTYQRDHRKVFSPQIVEGALPSSL